MTTSESLLWYHITTNYLVKPRLHKTNFFLPGLKITVQFIPNTVNAQRKSICPKIRNKRFLSCAQIGSRKVLNIQYWTITEEFSHVCNTDNNFYL